MKIDMVVFGEDWGAHPSSTQHLVKHLMREQQVLWVNSLGLRRPQFTRRDLQRAWNKLGKMFSSAVPSQDSLAPEILNPRVIPWPGNPLARVFNARVLQSALKPLLHQQTKAPLLWTSLPSAVDVVGTLGERASVFYCGDDFSALDGVDHQPVAEMEQELVAKVDLVIAASDRLAQKFPDGKTIVLPHGVDVARFANTSPRAEDLPAGPVAGFYGALADWFDQALFIEVCRRLPHWSFVLIGPANTDISALLAEPNVCWLGPKAHADLPRYSQHWDVGLLPFKHNAQITACNPLKLREYLAAGSPVVTTDFPALNGYRDLVQASDTAEGFARAIKTAYAQKTQPRIHRWFRQQRVRGEDWATRAGELRDALSAL